MERVGQGLRAREVEPARSTVCQAEMLGRCDMSAGELILKRNGKSFSAVDVGGVPQEPGSGWRDGGKGQHNSTLATRSGKQGNGVVRSWVWPTLCQLTLTGKQAESLPMPRSEDPP